MFSTHYALKSFSRYSFIVQNFAMLTKSKTNAILMATICLMSAIGMYYVLWSVIGLDANNTNSDHVSDFAVDFLVISRSFIGVLIAFGIPLIFLSWIIYKLDESHFGWRGLVKWIVSGAFYALLMFSMNRFYLANTTVPMGIGTKLVKDFIQILIIGLTYLLVFSLPTRLQESMMK